MSSDRAIGRAVRVKTYQALVELSQDTTSYVKSSLGGMYAIGVINSFVIIPVGSERVVAVVTALDMAEEPEASIRNRQMLVIARPRRTMWVSMIGTITQTNAGKAFEYGVKRYPELDNPVWFASEDDLDVIFGKAAGSSPSHVVIGKSPVFTDYDVSIDINKFFGKHAAILGNTGSGKSCTVTALITAVLEKGMPNAHFVIFDTNNEYERAFTKGDTKLFSRLVLRNDGDVTEGLAIPHWFMNSLDYHAFFRPGEGAQAPLLFSAISAARAGGHSQGAQIQSLSTLSDTLSQIDSFLENPPVGPSARHARNNLRSEFLQPAFELVEQKKDIFKDNGKEDSWEVYRKAFECMLKSVTAGYGSVDALMNAEVRKQMGIVSATLTSDQAAIKAEGKTPIGVDSPTHFDFNEFVTQVFPAVLNREARRNPALRHYVGTLQLRLDQARQDPRYSFLFGVQTFEQALASFLRLLLGAEPAHNFSDAPPPWKTYYEEQHVAPAITHQITILDLSQLASEVLENITALIGRLVLEFMQRIPQRGQFPVVLVLEEAHHYIPAHATLERQVRAREVFEKIAKEGRKFGLSLLVASQRPSELSKTVLAQCNSFIVHRIQNPDDQAYFRSVVSGINKELLDQLPALAQQQAIVIGDCVTLPLQVRLNTVDPRPKSDDPDFAGFWQKPDGFVPDFEGIAGIWEGKPGEGPPPPKASNKRRKKQDSPSHKG